MISRGKVTLLPTREPFMDPSIASFLQRKVYMSVGPLHTRLQSRFGMVYDIILLLNVNFINRNVIHGIPSYFEFKNASRVILINYRLSQVSAILYRYRYRYIFSQFTDYRYRFTF